MITVTKTSIVTGETRSMELDITEEQLSNYNNGMLVQNAFPNLSAEEREFLITGITPDEWNAAFPDRDDE